MIENSQKSDQIKLKQKNHVQNYKSPKFQTAKTS